MTYTFRITKKERRDRKKEIILFYYAMLQINVFEANVIYMN